MPSAGSKILEKLGMISSHESFAFGGGMMHLLAAAFTIASVMCATGSAFAGNDADRFLALANASPLNEADCTNAGGIDVIQPLFNKVIKTGKRPGNEGSVSFYEGKTYVVFMVPDPYLGRAVQTMHLCEFR
jgi:hypothetical protein